MNIKFSDLEVGDSLWAGNSSPEYFIEGLDMKKELILSLYYIEKGKKNYTQDMPYPKGLLNSTFKRHKHNKVSNWKKRIQNGI